MCLGYILSIRDLLTQRDAENTSVYNYQERDHNINNKGSDERLRRRNSRDQHVEKNSPERCQLKKGIVNKEKKL